MLSLRPWYEEPPGGLLPYPGNSVEVDTGAWRSRRPVIALERCVHCMICWAFCPDSAFIVQDGRLIGVDLEHCKGCGICARECPKACIAMEPEPALTPA
ncbi:Pyruvate synthase subunit PorD [bacterium HR23]|nr:Pyruvate synthase subunit PorD [bacterium HR23]